MLELVAARALELVRGSTVLGLGSGRAATAFIHALADEVKRGWSVRGVPTSEATARLARELGIPLAEPGPIEIDATVDGADEVDPKIDLIKGWGGALARERIVAAASRRQIILVGPEKLVPVLGTRGRLPVEVLTFALPWCAARLERMGHRPRERVMDDGRPFVTDNGNRILDCAVQPITDPPAVNAAIRSIPGVVDVGLFLGTAHTVLVGENGGVRVLERKSPA